MHTDHLINCETDHTRILITRSDTNQYNNSLVNTLIFLLLGLGVDDAFVLAGEFRLATKLHPELSIEERVALACKTVRSK